MDRNKIAMERERQERERQGSESNTKLHDAEQEVTKHFEESLRRAKEKVCLYSIWKPLIVGDDKHIIK